jgi:hypothetical protein
VREKPFLRVPKALVAAALALSSLAGTVALAAPASAGPQILNPLNPFDIRATEMWLPYGNRDRLWFSADNAGGSDGRITAIKCQQALFVDLDRPDGGHFVYVNFTVKVSADLPVGSWVGWEFKMPNRLLRTSDVVCTFVGVDANGRAELDTRNNSRVVYGYGDY